MLKTILKNRENTSNVQKKIDWNNVNEKIKTKLGNDIYESWIKKLTLVEEFEHYIVVSAPTRFIRDWVVSRYLDQILEIVKIYNNNISRIDFRIDLENSNESNLNQNLQGKNNVTFIEDSKFNYSRIDHNKDFDNFVVGSSNYLAYEACKKVCEQLSHYNPLFLYGGVGMGKTHLLNAVGLKLKDNFKVIFISAERFMYQFVKSIKKNDMVKFKDFFRDTDVLIIDDIQFASGKEIMQEEFFHTLNSLIEKNSQVVLSSDRPPNKLVKMQERIKSRMSGGLVLDIQKSDLDLRINILNKKLTEAKIVHNSEIELDKHMINFLSTEISISNRELIGALNRIISFSRVYKKLPSISEARVILKDLLNFHENKILIRDIQNLVCKYFKISKNEMLSPRRSRYLVRPRQIAMYLSKNLTSKSLPDIGREFSNRDHTTVIHSVKVVEKLKYIDEELKNTIDKIKNDILYNRKDEI